VNSLIHEDNYEYLHVRMSDSEMNPGRGDAIKKWLQQYGSICGEGLLLDFGVLFDYKHCRYRVGNDVRIGSYSVMGWGHGAPKEIIIEDGVEIGSYFSLTERIKDPKWNEDMSLRIGKSSVLQHRVTLAPYITVGQGAMIYTGSIVLDDIPEYAIVSGAPAEIIGYRQS
jgi:acetyltransferase-like isoleucine patch superfamily enzyme